MRRREFFSWLGGVGAAGLMAENLKGIILPMKPKDEEAIMLSEDPNPHDFIDISYHFRNNLEHRLFRAFSLNDCNLRTYYGRVYMASLMTPIVNRYMQVWRERTGIHPVVRFGDNFTQPTPIKFSTIQNTEDSYRRMILVAEYVGDSIMVLKERERLSPQGSGGLVTVVSSNDRPDMRIINFDITTAPVGSVHGR
jgi:hypothetical protein